jgi:uncharacterized protein YodC (DUF2158 family)
MMNKFQTGDKVRLTNQDPKVRHCPGTVTNVEQDRIEVVLELWCRWGTYSKYFPLWFSENELEKI